MPLRSTFAKTRAIAEGMARRPTPIKIAAVTLPSVAIVAAVAAMFASSYSQRGVPAPHGGSQASHGPRLASAAPAPARADPAPAVPTAPPPRRAHHVVAHSSVTHDSHTRHRHTPAVRPRNARPAPTLKLRARLPSGPVTLHHPRHLDPVQPNPGDDQVDPNHDGKGEQPMDGSGDGGSQLAPSGTSGDSGATGDSGDSGSTGDGGSDQGSTGDSGPGGGGD